jgi:VanZ family protein
MVILFQKIFSPRFIGIKITNIKSINLRDLFPMTKKFFYYQFPWLFLMMIIFIQSSIGSLKLPDIEFEFTDKLLHFIVFGTLGILIARGFRNLSNKRINENYLSLTIIISILYGASDEIHQYLVPGRYSSFEDWIADVLGIIIMVWIYKGFIRYRELKNKKLSQNGTMI